MGKLIEKIESYKTVCSVKHNNQYGHSLKFKNNEDEYFFSMYSESAFTWNMAITKALSKDLTVEIEFTEDHCITSLLIV